ncbi:FBD domain-containing protein [Heracleum sosnowskyi]|uniref:FBD domain-containing protein n=1 Tax=Heracleum sosnowskyi TaxID=360622 RepID=A0AAD8M0W7_9APIA|nr:FBD domain-containing protein [Heracleum sosnowskyi]
MAECSTRKISRIHLKKDRISVLPRNIQETILCFLPIRDAVRTSVLSRSWRHCWTTIPNLVSDENILTAMSITFDNCHGSELAAVKFVSVINKVLLLHNGPILKFSLSFPSFCDGEIIHNYVDQWIPLFSRKGVKQLTLEGNCHGDLKACNYSSLDLTHLRLAFVWLPYTPAFRGLTYLRIIELIEVGASEQNIIFDCPVLEKLTLICTELLPFNFRAPKLKILHQMYGGMTSEYSLAGLENLKEFSCGLSYDPEMPKETSNVVKVFGNLHKIEKISIAKCFITYLAAGGSPNRFPNPLPYLKTLSISNINLNCLSEVSCLLCLLRSAPNLCKLHISANQYAEEENFKDYWKEDFENYAVGHLEIVTFSYLKGLQVELELVKFLLAHTPLLKTMFIHRDPDVKKDVAIKMLEEMVEFSRASSRAQIKHLKCPSDAVDYGAWVNQLNIYVDELIFL